MITTTLGDLVAAEEALHVVTRDVKLPYKQLRALDRLARLMKTETDFFRKQRDELFRQLGEPAPGEPEGTLRIAKENQDEFMRRFNELLVVDASLECEPLDFEAIENDVKITLAEFNALRPILKD